MSKNENQDFDKILREIKELSKKLEESLEGSHTTIYKNKEKNEIQYKGGCIDNKYNRFWIKYNYYQKLEYEGFFTDGKKMEKDYYIIIIVKKYISMEYLIWIIILKEYYMIQKEI